MGCFFSTLALLLVGGLVYAYVRWRERWQRTEFRLGQLESEIATLRAQWASGGVAAAPVAPAPAETPVDVPADIPADFPAEVPAETSAGAPARATAAEPTGERVAAAALSGEPAEPTAGEAEPPAPETPEPELPAVGEPPSEPPRRRRIGWEQWVGVRGAGLLGAIALALAGILFVRYSIEAGLISPALRVAIGALAGTAALVAGELLRSRGYTVTANGLSGAGLVLLYAATWAARSLYGLLGPVPALVVFVVITAAGGALSFRHRSLVIALLGLIGGFLTPVLIASDSDNPIGLFAYLLLLNGGVALLARRMHWPWLTLLGLVATAVYQLSWMGAVMGPEEIGIGLVVLGAFALFFLLVGPQSRGGPASEHPLPALIAQIGGVLTPFLFAFYFALNARLDVSLLELGGLLVPLVVGAAWLTRVHRAPAIELAAASGVIGILLVSLGRLDWTLATTWTLVGLSVTFAVVHLAFRERDRLVRQRAAGAGAAAIALPRGSSLPTLVSASGTLVMLVAVPFLASFGPGVRDTFFWVASFAWAVLTAVLLRLGQIIERGLPGIIAGVVDSLGLSLSLLMASHPGSIRHPSAVAVVATALFFGIALSAWALLGPRTPSRPAPAGSRRAAGLLPLGVLAATTGASALQQEGALGFFGACLLLALLVLLAALQRGRGGFLLAVAAAWALSSTAWVEDARDDGSSLVVAGFLLLAPVVLSLWPTLFARRLGDLPARMGSALAPALFFPALGSWWSDRWGEGAIGLLPLLLAGVALLGAQRGAVRLEEPSRRSALAWQGAAALGLVAAAVPLQLDKEWITVGWAVQAFLVILLWKRLDHVGLKFFATALFVTVTVRLVLNPAVLTDYPAGLFGGTGRGSGLPFFNWLLYSYLVPAAALLGAGAVLGPLEGDRLRAWERSVYPRGRPWIAGATGLMAVLVIFAWLNLSVIDAFTPAGMPLSLTWHREPARDLSLSVAWGVFALALLAAGVLRRSVVLRWVSLVFLLLTIGKVFLYDLGQLKDLYRVASLVGLAASLIVVSLLYQRFVFRGRRGSEEDPD